MAPRWASRTADGVVEDRVSRSSSFSMWTRWWPARSRASSCSPARAAVAVEGQPFEGLVPGGLGRGLDAHLISARSPASGSAFVHRSSASTTTATSPNWSRSRTRSGHCPWPRRTPLRRVPLVLPRSRIRQPRSVCTNLGVVAADGAVVEHDLERIEPADAQQFRRFPRLALERPVHAT